MSPRKIPDSVLSKSLTTHAAIDRLVSGIEEIERDFNPDLRSAFRRALSPTSPHAVFPATAIAAALAQSVLLFLSFNSESGDGWNIFQGVLVFLLAAVNAAVVLYDRYLLAIEMKMRVRHVAIRLKQVREHIFWQPVNYPHLHTPEAASIVLQWTLRDGAHVNLPWALLVKGDIIMVKPGQVVPGACHSVDDASVRMSRGDILHINTHNESVSPTPEFKSPARPKLFVMDETPYFAVLRKVLHRDEHPEPLLVTKISNLFFTRALVHILLPCFFVLAFVLNFARHESGLNISGAETSRDLWQLLVAEPVAVTLPFVSLSFPLCWIVVNYLALAWVFGVYGSARHVSMTDDPFDDNVERSEQIATNQTSWWRMKNMFKRAVFGTGEYLSRTENIVHTLGCITALCCTDKKGILSWPNQVPERIFLVKKVPKPARQQTSNEAEASDFAAAGDDPSDQVSSEGRSPPAAGTSSAAGFDLVPEILSVTHDPRNPFKVEFDDPSWQSYMNYLLPLGLSIVLNTCNISTEEKYTNFFNHLVCESVRVDGHGHAGKRSNIDVLPIVTRGCLCELARKIGFGPRTAAQYTLSSQIQTFRHVEANKNDKFARKLSLARLKFPFPHLVSVMVQQRSTGARQLISQGTTDIVLDSCVDCWSGNDLEPLTQELRKKVLDFYQRASLSSFCTAFSYRPQTFPLPWRNCKEYLQLPTQSNPFYWQYAEHEQFFDADSIAMMGHIGRGWDRGGGGGGAGGGGEDARKAENYVKTKGDAMTLLELECNQTFLGMVQMQYQAVVDIVQLIDLLEKACIRFVHFSRDNELRSRVFSEKMGLESGWNCHISLKSAGEAKPSTVTFSSSDAAKHTYPGDDLLMTRYSGLGSSLPGKLNRPAWFLDFPRWQETNKGAWNNGGADHAKSESMETVVEEEDLDDAAATTASMPQRPAQSSAASVASDSDQLDYDMSNRAQLPRGIENIRPHLETMDNVPLLVSLFTDCVPATTKEMLKIMQEYGEVVCVMGSSANYSNIEVFLQANASMAIEPRYPQLCQSVPVSLPPKVGPSPVATSQLLNSVASSLSFKMEDSVSIFHLILESRHFTLCLMNALKYWICCLLSLGCIQLLSLLVTLPLFLTAGQTLWMSLLIVPALSLSLLAKKADANHVMNISTGKNSVPVNSDSVKYAAWCYGLRFAPAIIILVFSHLLNILDLVSCAEEDDISRAANWTEMSSNCPESVEGHSFAGFQLCNFVFAFVYLSAISLSFISRNHQLWQFLPTRAWLLTFFALAVVVALYVSVAMSVTAGFVAPSTHVGMIWGAGVLLVILLNECVVKQEIKVEFRYQRRERLEFGTKLGINSPF